MLVGGSPGERPCILGIKLLIHHFEKLWHRRRAQASRYSSQAAAGLTGVMVPETDRLDWINKELRQQGHAVKTFRDVDAAMQQYAQVIGHNLDPLGPKPQLADFYHPSDGQKDCWNTLVAMADSKLSALYYSHRGYWKGLCSKGD